MILIVSFATELLTSFKWKCAFSWKFRPVLMNKDKLPLLNRIVIYKKKDILENSFKKKVKFTVKDKKF